MGLPCRLWGQSLLHSPKPSFSFHPFRDFQHGNDCRRQSTDNQPIDERQGIGAERLMQKWDIRLARQSQRISVVKEIRELSRFVMSDIVAFCQSRVTIVVIKKTNAKG